MEADVPITDTTAPDPDQALVVEVVVGKGEMNHDLTRLNARFERLNLQHLQCSSPNQGLASSFSEPKPRPLCGFGSLPSNLRIDPTDDCMLTAALIPSCAHIACASSNLPLMGEMKSLLPRGKDSHGGIRSIMNAETKTPLLAGLQSNCRTTLGELQLSYGVADDRSCPDCIWTGTSAVVGNFVIRGGESSTLLGLREAAVTGTNIAMSLLRKGISIDQCIVPACAYTGMLMQFGATIVLQPSFPVFICTSKVLDLGDETERRVAAAYLDKAKEWTAILDALTLSASPIEIKDMVIDISQYHIKVLSDDVVDRGLGLFGDCGDISQGLEHMSRALNVLYAVPELREYVVFPLALRTPDEIESKMSADRARRRSPYHWLIYKDLTAEGYRIGTPNRLATCGRDVYKCYVAELRRIIEMVHSAGVLHCDLYPSNIMWKLSTSSSSASSAAAAAISPGAEPQQILIKIIDWDCAHCLSEGEFHPNVARALSEHSLKRCPRFHVQHDIDYIDVLDRDVRNTEEKIWSNLASNDKRLIDDAFYRLYNGD
jgi:hypothetical protein